MTCSTRAVCDREIKEQSSSARNFTAGKIYALVAKEGSREVKTVAERPDASERHRVLRGRALRGDA